MSTLQPASPSELSRNPFEVARSHLIRRLLEVVVPKALPPFPNAGHFRAIAETLRDVAAIQPGAESNASVMSDMPASVDIAFVFNSEGAEKTGYFETLRSEYVPALHAKGTQVVRSIGVNHLLALPVQKKPSGYDQLARQLIAENVTVDGLDGIDIDMEQVLTSAEAKHVGSIIKALSAYLGPASGTDTLLIYDTNLNGDQPLFRSVAPLLSYVLIQSYGRSVSGLESTWQTYAPYISSCQYMIGFSFYEERGAYWGDTLAPFDTSRAAAYARWEPAGGRNAGIFSYAIDRDWKAQGDDTITAPDYSWTTQLAALQDAQWQ